MGDTVPPDDRSRKNRAAKAGRGGVALTKSVSGKLARRGVAVAVVFGVLVSLVQIYNDYKQQGEELERSIEQIGSIVRHSVRLAVYELNETQAAEIAQGLLAFRSIISVEIQDEHGELITTQQRLESQPRPWWIAETLFPSNKQILTEVELFGDGNEKALLIIGVDTYYSAQQFIERSSFILLAGIVRNTLLAIAFLYLSYLTVSRPLAKLTRTLMKMDITGATNSQLSIEKRHQDDEIGALSSTINLLFDLISDSFAALNREIAMHEQAAASLSESEGRFRDFADIGADWFWETGPKLQFSYLAGSIEQVLGLTCEELLGSASVEFYEQHCGLDSVELEQHLQTLSSHQAFVNVILSCGHTNGEIRVVSFSGQPRFAADGGFLGYRGTGRDVSELQKVEQQLRRAQKMDAIGQLSGGIAHDFNNILGIILGNLELLEMEAPERENAAQRLADIEVAANRAAVLTKQLLGFSRSQPAETIVTDVNRMFGEMESLIRRSITPEIEVELALAENLWLTRIDPGDCQDAVLNLIINARDAMEGGGTLTLETSNQCLDAGYCANNPGILAGDYVQLAISDTGTGIPADLQDRIFEPFFTTKEQGRGTGLGLAMVYGFAKRSGGHIKAYSEQGLGTTFRLLLPRSGEVDTPMQVDQQALQALPVGSETILVVDDEPALLELARDSLESLGYEVLTAGDGPQALAVLAGEVEIDLLFSDVVMPGGIGGLELAEQVSVLYPQLRVLLTSGYTGKAVAHQDTARPRPYLLPKPYSRRDLATQVRKILAAPPRPELELE